MIVKRIYFPDSTYSQNESEFKKILGTYGLSWQESIRKVYENDKKIKLLTGIYISTDKSKRMFAFYEGHEKPATFIVKILGGGGNFLIDLNSLCHNTGCIIDDRDERYIEDILLRLRNFGDINLPEDVKKRKDEEKEKGEDGKILKKGEMSFFDIKLVRIVRIYLRRYVVNNGKSLGRRGISIKVARLFKKKQVKNNAMWVLENGWIEKKKRWKDSDNTKMRL
jgi:hypothetical protein